MVEIDSENSSILESPETMEKKDKAWKLEKLEEEISKLRYKKSQRREFGKSEIC